MPEATTRPIAGPIGPSDYILVIQGGALKKMPVPQGLGGWIRTRNLLVDGSGLYTFSQAADQGYVLLAYGIDQQVIELVNEATAPKDFTYGSISFMVQRLANGTVDVNPKIGATGTGVEVVNPLNLELIQDGPPLCFTCHLAQPNKWIVT